MAIEIAVSWRKANIKNIFIVRKEYGMMTKWLIFVISLGCKCNRNSYHSWQLKWPVLGKAMESNWIWMTKTCNLFHAASSLCHFINRISRRAVAGQSLSNTWPDVLSGWEIWRCAGQGSNQISCLSRKVRTWHVTCSLAQSYWKMPFGRPYGAVPKMEHKYWMQDIRNIPICVQITADRN